MLLFAKADSPTAYITVIEWEENNQRQLNFTIQFYFP